jgi:hypothetical protein
VPYGLTFIAAMLSAYIAGHLGNLYLLARKKIKAPKDDRRVSVWMYWRTMPEYITAFDELFARALRDDKLVLISLKSRKVYCGLITETRGDHDSAVAHVQFLPSFSITRDKEKLQFDWATKTEYIAYSLKRTAEREASIQAEIESAKQAIAFVERFAKERPAIAGLQREFVARARMQIEDSQKECERLGNVLKPYLRDGQLSVSDWVKVIPVTEIESVTIYKDDDYQKWFKHAQTSQANNGQQSPSRDHHEHIPHLHESRARWTCRAGHGNRKDSPGSR